MPIRDTDARNRSLDNDYGTTAGPNAAIGHELALFYGDPMTDGVEASGGGYSRVAVDPPDWLPSADGMKTLADVKTLPSTTDAWADTVTHWGLYDAADSTTMWDCGPLADVLEVTGAGAGPTVNITVFYDDSTPED